MIRTHRISLRKILLVFALMLFLILPFLLTVETPAATGTLYEQASLVSGQTYVIVGPGIQANGDTSSKNYAISCEKAYSDGLSYEIAPTSNPKEELLWTITSEGNGKYSLYSVKAKKYLTLQGSSIVLSDTKQGLYIVQSSGYFNIYLDTTHYLRFTNTNPGSRWHCGSNARNFKLYSTDKGYGEYTETDTPIMTVACFSDMHHEYGIQYTSTATRASSVKAYNYAKSVINNGKGADVVLIGGDVSGRRSTRTGGNTWSAKGFGDDGSQVISNMMSLNYRAFQTASKDGKVLIVTGNHDPEPSVNMESRGDDIYPAVNSNDWMSYMVNGAGNPSVSVSYRDLGISTDGVPDAYRNEVLGYVYQIKGMYFLGLNTPFGDHIAVGQEGVNGLYVAQVEWAGKQLAAIGKDKTVIFMCHYPLNGMPTVTSAKGNVSSSPSPACDKMKQILAQYPNVIYTYGHHHAGDAQILSSWAGEKIVPLNGNTRLKNEAFLASGWLHTYMGSLGYYDYSLQTGGLTADDIKVVQFLTIEFYANHITFKYYNRGTNVISGASWDIASYTVARDLSSQFGVASVPFDTTPAGTVGSGTTGSTDTGANTGSNITSNTGTPSNTGTGSGNQTTDVGNSGSTGNTGVSGGNTGNESDLTDRGQTSDPAGTGTGSDGTAFTPPVIDTQVNDTDPDTNALNGNIGGTAEELKQAVLTDYEQEWAANGDEVKIWLTVTDISETVESSAKDSIQKQVGNGTVGAWLDLKLFSQMEGEDPVQVKETNGKITVTLTVPEALRKAADGVQRRFSVVRSDADTASVLAAQYDGATGLLAFETDGFSAVYALVYEDTKTPVSTSQTGSTDTDTTDPDTADGSPATDAPAKGGLPVGAVVAIVIGAVLLLGAGGFCLWYFVLRKKKSSATL